MDGLGFAPSPQDGPATGRGQGEDRSDRVVRLVRSEIIPRLLSARRDGERRILPVHVDTLARLSLSRDPSGALSHVMALREAGAPVEALLNDLIGPAARRLGAFWTADVADFVDVAVGVGRLCAVVRALGAHIEPAPAPGAPAALIATLGAERHGLGALVLAQTLRLGGWRVRETPGAETETLLAQGRAGPWRLIGLSLGGAARLDEVGGLIARLRAAAGQRRPAIAVGGPACMADPGLAARLGADFQATDAREAAALARDHLSGGQEVAKKA